MVGAWMDEKLLIVLDAVRIELDNGVVREA